MPYTIEVQRASRCTDLPPDSEITRWAESALTAHCERAELSVRIVDEEESRELNHSYRGLDKPTNVLSFPAELPPELQQELELPLLGDLVICAPVVAREAEQQHKLHSAHWAHMVVHGTLHLLGYDHIEDEEAAVMEQLETQLLIGLGFADPYADPCAETEQ